MSDNGKSKTEAVNSSVTPDPRITPDPPVTPDPRVTLVQPVAEVPTAPPVLEDTDEIELDPLDALEDPTADDPDPEVIEDEKDPNFCAPAEGISPRKKV